MDKTISRSAVAGIITPPCSKSYAQRCLAGALLAEGETLISNIQPCDDTMSAVSVITALGAEVSYPDATTIKVLGGLNPRSTVINTGESGLATRLFTPIAALSDRPITIEGSGTMLHRPVSMMIKPLENLGARVESDGNLPITVQGPLRGGKTFVDSTVSSQFITGLLTATPLAKEDTIIYTEQPNSIPYLAMTIDMAKKFGVKIEHNGYSEYYIAGGQSYRPGHFEIEGDWSSAAFMLVAGAIAGSITIANLNPMSLQADRVLIEALSKAGAELTTTGDDITVIGRKLRGFDFDATQCPDLFPALCILAANCSGTSRIRGTKRLTFKESDRAKAITTEYKKLGIKVKIKDDVMTVKGGRIKGGTISGCGDHRIAMAGAIAALTSEKPVTITGAEAVSKSYPRFWDDLAAIMVNKQEPA